MDTCVLFSGGKDSTLTLSYALKFSKVKCLVTIASENAESFMFHTPNIKLAERQAECIGIPIIVQKTKGVKEKELKDLEKALLKAKKNFKIQGVVTGAVESAYQASRVQKTCAKLGLECFNPLWQKNQIELLEELQKEKIRAIIVGVFAPGIGEFLGKNIDREFISKIRPVAEKYGINPAGEGGELESFVLDAPFYKKKIKIAKSRVLGKGAESLVLEIGKIELVEK